MPQLSCVLRTAIFGLLATAALPAADPDPIYKALREASLADVLVVDNIVLQRDAGTITLKSGAIAFTAPAMGRDTVAVFVGEGELSLTPAVASEKAHMKVLTDQETFKDTFDRALFCFTDGTGKEIRDSAKSKSASKLDDVLRDYRKRLREDGFENVEATILADLYNAKQAGFFTAYFHGRKHPDLRFQVRPRGAIPQISPEEVHLESVQPSGVPDLSLYLTHLTAELKDGSASSDENKRVVEAESYKIVTAIAKNDHFTATTELRFRVVSDGDRVIPMGLVPTLRVSKVTIDGVETGFIQEGMKLDGAFYVVLPQALEKGSSHVLTLEYQGDKVVRKAGGGNFAVGARQSWYPNVNSFKDHARYDLTFRVPKQYTLVSIGKLAKETTEKDEIVTQWVSDNPIAVAGFNYGTFKKKVATDAQSGMIVEGYATTDLPDFLKEFQREENVGSMSPSILMDKTMAEAQVATRIFNGWFGKSAFGRVAVTQQPQMLMGQSWPSLVYLPLTAFLDSTVRWKLFEGDQASVGEFVDEVTAHEVAHQWWGHMVGWSSYHDQWLSEGFANFSASLFLQFTNKTMDKFNKYWETSRTRLFEKNAFGKRANDAGPVWMGLRLSNQKIPGAYNRVVYDKGGYVLHMLRWMMFDQKEGDKYFIAMMRDFVAQQMNKNASTESFQAVVEKHIRPVMNAQGNGKMDWFFWQWVYGTAVPRYKLDQAVTANPDGSFQLKGSITQSEIPQDFIMVVPLYADFDGIPVRLGAVRMHGNATVPFDIQLPKKPRRVLLNANHDVLEQ